MKSALKVLALLASALTPLLAFAQYGSTFQHVVVIFQENRTPDNLFQGLCTANGAVPGCKVGATTAQYNISSTYVNSAGKTTALAPVGLATNFDLDHSHGGPGLNGTVSGWNFEYTNQGIKGKPGMVVPPSCGKDIFGCAVPSDSQFMYVYNTAVTNTDGSSGGLLDPYITLATRYGWANRMFQTNQGPSYPAHQFIFGATSAPTATDDVAGIFVSENAPGNYGCASGNSVQLIRPNTNTAPPYGTETRGDTTPQCFQRNAMDFLLTKQTWTYYAAGQTGLWVAPNSLMNICTPSNGLCTGPDWTKGSGSNGFVDPSPPDVLTDISNCALPNVSWVTPAGAYSDHPMNSGQGPSWVAAIVNAIGNNKTCDTNGYWNDTVIFITWDDWGGWYDHVPPVFQMVENANQKDYQLGFRVPLVVVSAYSTKAGYISNNEYDFGSILKATEEIFGLGNLGFADARATNDLSDFFNLKQTATPYTTIPAPLDATFFTTGAAAKEVDPPDTD